MTEKLAGKLILRCVVMGFCTVTPASLCAQQQSGQWNTQTAGASDLFRGPMRASEATSGRASTTGQQSTAGQAITPRPAWVRPAGYQPPSVQSLPQVQTGQPLPAYLPPNQPPVYQPAQPYTQPYAQPSYGQQPRAPSPSDYSGLIAPGATAGPQNPYAISPTPGAIMPPAPTGPTLGPRDRIAPLDVYLQEKRSGRIMIGGTVNSELGVAGQIILEERNFDWREWTPGPNLFYGGGQLLRIELMPGNEVQRYTVNWTQPNLFGNLPYSLSIGGFYFTRDLRNWGEQRGGGRIQLGNEITRNLSFNSEIRLEDVNIFRPSKLGVADLDAALGSNDVYRARFKLSHDTRDSPFMARQGSLLELVFDQVFGEYDFSRGQVNWSNHRVVGANAVDPNASQQTLSSLIKFGITGSQTPIFENFYAGGLSTIRGFDFRGASPREMDVEVGGELMLLGSLEYGFAITQDDLYRGVMFVDAGTVEQDLSIKSDNIRLSLGAGLRLSIPALGPAPLALDFAYPVMMADTDERQIFGFYLGATR